MTFNPKVAMARKLKSQKEKEDKTNNIAEPSSDDTPKERPQRAPKPKQEQKAKQQTQAIPRPLVHPEMSARLFIASVGNPAPYYNTLHSAGHHLVDTLQRIGCPHTLYKSSSLMNVSGANVIRAYRSFLSTLPADERNLARLVVLHDELELPLGQLKLRESGSLKGHNGLKSIKATLGGKEFARLGIGIGRPESREKGAVSDYVLRKMTGVERGKIESRGEVAMMLLEKLGSECGA